MKTKRFMVMGALLALVAGTTEARLGDPINTRQKADVSRRAADLPTGTIELNRVPLNTVPLGGASQSDQRYATKTVEQKRVETETLRFSRVDAPQSDLPRSNFTAKRAAESDRNIASETVTTERVTPPGKRIRAQTPAGTTELREQLNRRPDQP